MTQIQAMEAKAREMRPAITCDEEQLTSPPHWTAEELRAAIERCERDVEALVMAHAEPEKIYQRRAGLGVLYLMLGDAYGDGIPTA